MSDAAGYAPAEQRARMLINRQLLDAGWIVQDKNHMNLFAGVGVTVREVVMAPGHSRVDFLPYAGKQAVGVIEAAFTSKLTRHASDIDRVEEMAL